MSAQEKDIEFESDETAGIYVMSVAAELVGTHPQTLRDYERKGLLSPQRTQGGNRRYTQADIKRIMRIKALREEGMSVTAIAQLLEYEQAMLYLKHENETLKSELEKTQKRLGNVEDRLHHVESTIEKGSKALVKVESKEFILSVKNSDKKGNKNN